MSRALARLSCRLSRQFLRPVGMGIMHRISSEIDAILREEIELAQKDDPALIVRSAFEVIEDFLSQGMSLERIAAALQKHDIKITKGHLVRHLGIVRTERGLKPLKRGRKSSSTGAPALAKVANAEPPPSAKPDSPAVASDWSQTAFPDDISSLKFIEVNGERLDVTRMNIDDYLTVSKTLPANAKIPDGMFDIIAAENRIRGMYERALRQYDAAIAKWKSSLNNPKECS
ncbi:MAG: hypothetical protein KAY82_00670 [Hylemonella sp.]|nr:hypothetical protein [Hylemonella sp.]